MLFVTFTWNVMFGCTGFWGRFMFQVSQFCLTWNNVGWGVLCNMQIFSLLGNSASAGLFQVIVGKRKFLCLSYMKTPQCLLTDYWGVNSFVVLALMLGFSNPQQPSAILSNTESVMQSLAALN